MIRDPDKTDHIIEKIKKIYESFGMDTSDMEEEEFERLKREYLSKGLGMLELDLREAEKRIRQIALDSDSD